MIKRIQNLLGEGVFTLNSSLFPFKLKSIGLALVLFFSLGSNTGAAQGVSIAFSSGYLGTQASATQQTTNIKNLSTLGIVRVSFSQTYAGTFGGTQGNDLSGIIRLYLNSGQIISLTGSLNWRETTGNALDIFGLIFDPGQNATITYGSNQTYNIVGGSTNSLSTSLGLKAYASSVTFTDGSSRSGNAATSSIIQDINSELATSPQPSSISLTNPSVIEGVNLVYTVNLSTATVAGRPQVFTFSTSGSAGKGSDYNTIYTFSNGVVDNLDGTITVPGSVSSFTITITTIDDLLIESIESVILSVGSKNAIGLIKDNDVPVAIQCDVNNPYDKIISGYHQSIAFKTDASFSVWGEDLDNSGAGNVLTPLDINSTNFPNLQTAIPLKAAIGGQGGGGKEQAILLTTAGLFAWGNPGYVLDATLTTSATFAKILGNQFTSGNANTTTGLPTGVNPYDVKMMTASYGTLIILTNSGDVWTLSNLSGSLNANGSATVNSKTWYKVKTNSTTYLSDITAIRVQASTSSLNAVIALKADGTVYTWGSSTYLGNGTAAGTLNYATQMTLPAEFTITNIPKMIAVTGGVKNTATVKNSLYILSNSGALYSLGYNAQKQLGDFTTTERTSWVNAKVNSTTNFSNVAFITAQEHDASFPGIAAVTKSGDLYTWGENEGLALGRNDSGSTYTTWDPGMPLGFTSGTDIALSAEMGGHTLVYLKQGTTQFCYVGHKTSGSMGDGISASSFINTFNCSGTPSLSICGSVPVAASLITSTISATPRSILANGSSTSAITVQLKQSNGTNLTTTGGAVIINSTKGTISSVTDNNDGTYSAILTSSTFVETANLSYTLNGSAGTNSTSVSFTPLTPIITVSSSLTTFTTCVGTASTAQSFTVSASNLTSNLTVTAPTGFELATSSSGTYSSSLVLTQSSGTVSTTTLWVRIKSSTLTSTSGNIGLTSTGATAGTISVTAQLNATPTISVNVIPDVTTSATSFTIPYTGLSVGDVYSLSAGTSAMTGFSPVVDAAISSSPLIITIPASTQNSYDFILTVKNSTSGCSIQRNFSLVVSDINPGTTGADQSICYGTIPATFTNLTDASAGGIGSPTYIWQISTTGVSGTYTDITGATAAYYTHPTALTADTYFRRKATIGVSFATAHPIEVIVNALPTISVSPSAPSITSGSSVSLTASGANSYSWTPSTGLSSTNTTIVTASPTSTTTYTVTGTNSTTSCFSTASVTVTVTIAAPADSDGDGVTDAQEAIDGTNPNDVCSYLVASQTLSPTSAWTNADCDGDGTPNGSDTDPKDPCVHAAGATPVTTNAIWRAADCDGDGVTNGKETDDNTNPNDGCDYKVASKTLTPSAAWNALDCDGDGTPNGSDTDPNDPCVHAAGARPVTTNSIWRAADCDGDGVTNGKESDDGTDPNEGCSYVLASRTLTPSAAWGNLDCDADGNSNATDPHIDTPEASNDAVTLPSSGSVTLNVLTNDDFLPGANTEITRQLPPNDGTAKGTVTFDGTLGLMSYKKAPFEFGTKTVGYKVLNKAVTPAVYSTAFVTILICDITDPLADCDGDGEPNGTDLAPSDPCVYAPDRQVKANVSDDWKALDCDGDGVINGTELTDGTSPSDGCSFKAPSISLAPSAAWLLLDCDADGITNKVEGTQDFDGDGIPNCLDTDSDGDSISDKLETTVDTDKDGKPDYLDLDSDNDGILDSLENKVCTGTGILCDTDADGTPNFRDLDSDADQIKDVNEANGSDYNKDGIADGNIDDKGIPTSANKGLTPPDTDRDGKYDPYDVDSDGDGILDYDEEFNEDGDFPDCDHDGVINRLDPDECEIFSPQGISPNGDGKNDRLVFKGLYLRKIPNHLSIYNRWGTLVYEMESYDNTFTGTSLPDGTYYYILDFFGKKPTISNYLSVDRTIK